MTFEEITSAYIAEKRAVGNKMEKGERVMGRIAALHDELGCPEDELPKELVEAWIAKKPGEAESNRLGRMSDIRGLAQYMVRMGYSAYVAPGKQGYRDRGAYDPHIFTDEELAALEVAPETLMSLDVDTAREALELLFRLEEEFGLEPAGEGKLAVSGKGKKGPKLAAAIKAWEEQSEALRKGEIAQNEYESWKRSFGA